MDGSFAPLPPLLRRRRFTGRDVERMIRAGVLQDKERIELIHGELIEMPSEGPPHWEAKTELVNWMLRRLPDTINLAPDGPLRLDEDEEPEPDFYLFPSSMRVNDVRGSDTLLVCEIADTSLMKDRSVKAPIYAIYGVQLYWIVDLIERRTLVHTLVQGLYGEPTSIPFGREIATPGIAEPLVLDSLLK